MSELPRTTRLLTGGAVFTIPDSAFDLLWIGPGTTRLYLTTATQMVPVEPERFRLERDTLKAARAAAGLFIAEGRED